MKPSALITLSLFVAPVPSMANPISRVFEECDRYKIHETYVSGSYDRQGRYQEGYVKSRRVKVPCGISGWSSGNTRPKQIKRCSSEGTTLGGLLGGGLAASLPKKDAYSWAIPLGAVLGMGVAGGDC